MCDEESCGVDSSCVLWRRKAKGGEGWERQLRSCGGAGGVRVGLGGARRWGLGSGVVS